MAKQNIWIVFGVIALLVMAATVAYNSFGGTAGTAIGANGQNAAGGTPGTNIVTTGATFSPSGADNQAQGTAVTGTYQVAAANANAPTAFTTFSTAAASYSPGQVLNLLFVNNTNYHNQYVPNHVVPSATSDNFKVLLNKNASITEVWNYPYSGLNIVNNGGANNLTNGGTVGASYTVQDTMYGTSLQSTQDMTCIIELSAGVNASTSPAGVVYSGNGATLVATSAPAFYSVNGANSRVWTYDIPALTSAQGTTYTLTASALPTKSFSPGTFMKKACYTKEWFIDPNTGLATYGVADSNNAVKSMALYTFTGYFT